MLAAALYTACFAGTSCQFVPGTDWQNAAGGVVAIGVVNATGCCAACFADAKCEAGVFTSSGCYLKYDTSSGAVSTPGVMSCVTSRAKPLPQPTLPPVQPGVTTTTISSEGRSIYVHVKYPENPRYGKSAPVIVSFPGGWSPTSGWGIAQPDQNTATHGHISVEWLMPGGMDRFDATIASGGDYDVRGPSCASAARDVLKFAAGISKDTAGRLITDIASMANTSIVGISASSNGGNLAIATIAHFGSSLPPIAFFTAGESPIGSQYADCEVNQAGAKPGASYDLSPFYEAGSSDADGAPYKPGFAAALVFDPSANMTLAMSTSLPNAMRTVQGRLSVRQPDGLRDLVMQEGADGRMYPSVQLTGQIVEASKTGLFGASGWPDWLASQEDATNFAEWRDGLRNIAKASNAQPNMLVTHIQSSHDHACQPKDWPHARSHMLGWHRAGHHWLRFNPDQHYVSLVRSDSPTSSFPQNPANDVSVVAWPVIQNTTLPNSQHGQYLTEHELAAALELADRTYFGEYSPTLSSVLVKDPQ